MAALCMLHRRPKYSLAGVTTSCIMRCGAINSHQSAATSGTVKRRKWLVADTSTQTLPAPLLSA